MDYVQKYNLLALTNPGSARIWKQTYSAILHAASNIRWEATETENHANRLIWAAEAEQNPASKWEQMKLRILEDETIAADPNSAEDSAVQNAVNSLINTYATGS